MYDYKQIDGWFNWEWFYDEAIKRAKDGDVIVEIGTWSGKSAIYLAEKIKESGKKIKVLCIDPYFYGLLGKEYGEQDFHRCIEFRRLVHELGLEDILISVLSKSEHVFDLIPDKSCIAVYIDGDHTFEGCYKDIAGYFSKVKSNGLIGGHDYESELWGTVVNAVDKWIDENKKKLQVNDDTWYIDLSLEK